MLLECRINPHGSKGEVGSSLHSERTRILGGEEEGNAASAAPSLVFARRALRRSVSWRQHQQFEFRPVCKQRLGIGALAPHS